MWKEELLLVRGVWIKHDYIYTIKRFARFVAVKDCTLRVIFSLNPRCEWWYNSWMSLIKITEQHVATWSEHVWLISVTVDAVYKVCLGQWGWWRNSSWMQPSSRGCWVECGASFTCLQVEACYRLLFLKRACVTQVTSKIIVALLIHDSNKVRIILFVMTMIDVSNFFFPPKWRRHFLEKQTPTLTVSPLAAALGICLQ